MNQLTNLPMATMNHFEIADLVDKRPDNVKRTIEGLAEKGIIRLPQFEVFDKINNLGLTIKVNAYVFTGEQGKRDSIITVAQLCPEFTARLVDRWQALERQPNHNVDLNNPHALRRALLEYTEQVIELEHKNIGLERSIQTITQTPTGVKFQQACKILNIKRQVLADWLSSHGWDRRLQNTRASTYYSQERGYCETKYEERTKIKANGELGSYCQIEFFILPKGMDVLAKHFGMEA